MADSRWADDVADRICELLNDYPDTYMPTVRQEVTTWASGATTQGQLFRAGLTGEDGDEHLFTITVTEVPRG